MIYATFEPVILTAYLVPSNLIGVVASSLVSLGASQICLLIAMPGSFTVST